MNTLGRIFRVSVLGESHGALVGAVIDGVPPGLAFGVEDVQPELDRRRPGQSLLATQRREEDRCEILSGVFEGRTTGAPILLVVKNQDARPRDYAALRNIPRPGHADYPAQVKSRGHADLRGGGMHSGRLTAALVAAGALARKVLSPRGVAVAAHTVRVGGVATTRALTCAEIRAAVEATPVRCADPMVAGRMVEEIHAARDARDSVGGVVECVVEGVPPGLGEPGADGVESLLAHALFAIPAVKGVEFGAGFSLGAMRGSQAGDPYAVEGGRVITTANHNGGLLGGMTTGMPLCFRAAFKPTSSIPLPQASVDLETGEAVTLEVRGRHDPCVVPRAVPVVEAVAALVLADLILLDAAWSGGG